MISERFRNIIVGMTILVALVVCMYGIILLGKFPAFSALQQYQVELIAPNANGVTAGSKVELNGVYAGQVSSVYLGENTMIPATVPATMPATTPGKQLVAHVLLQIDRHVDIPASAEASLVRQQAVGNPYVVLTATDATGPKLAKDGRAVLSAIAADSGLIPQAVFTNIYELKDQLGTLATELTTVGRDLHVLLAYAPPEAVERADPNDPNRVRENASTVIIRLNRIATSLEVLLTDSKLQGNVRQAIQNIADASTQLKSTLEKFETTASHADTALASFGTAATSISGAATQASVTLESAQKEINRVSQTLVETLSQMNKSLKEITEGSGTTGKLVNDPRLYEGLLDVSKSLKTAADNLNFLIDKWKDEGVNLHLGK